jgi:hypothetical protein
LGSSRCCAPPANPRSLRSCGHARCPGDATRRRKATLRRKQFGSGAWPLDAALRPAVSAARIVLQPGSTPQAGTPPAFVPLCPWHRSSPARRRRIWPSAHSTAAQWPRRGIRGRTPVVATLRRPLASPARCPPSHPPCVRRLGAPPFLPGPSAADKAAACRQIFASQGWFPARSGPWRRRAPVRSQVRQYLVWGHGGSIKSQPDRLAGVILWRSQGSNTGYLLGRSM